MVGWAHHGSSLLESWSRKSRRGSVALFMALPFSVDFGTPSLRAQGRQRRPPQFNIRRDIPIEISGLIVIS